ncbi:MAG: hypothetical protein MI674_07155 [Cytophagales bacterium]|nr:hypothetical protein [Cytophagales bacterium]
MSNIGSDKFDAMFNRRWGLMVMNDHWLLSVGKLTLAEECLSKGRDLPGLLLLVTARGSRSKLKELIPMAKEQGKSNIAFMAHFLLGDLDECIQLLLESGRMPEAAFFARTYAPSKMSDVVSLWQDDLKKINPKV